MNYMFLWHFTPTMLQIEHLKAYQQNLDVSESDMVQIYFEH